MRSTTHNRREYNPPTQTNAAQNTTGENITHQLKQTQHKTQQERIQQYNPPTQTNAAQNTTGEHNPPK
jgi:hypothetical protein